MKKSEQIEIIWDTLNLADKQMMNTFGHGDGLHSDKWDDPEAYKTWLDLIEIKNRIVNLKLKEIENESK